ncbi:thioesterase family protein [Loktanella sp. SALINAS62]|uniref:thioesterase family protein n=1 Tax=Loktanella sp. SALINAS62 TaxID=2706124 RepID=UPI001B8CBE93|nr:thioesterase family protein [Loktanella sp. SALINAS62]MBS1303945.1 carnitine 3-dehydrogenase [Loktanella sp. SALINAS62]
MAQQAAVLGGDAISDSWVARFVLMGWDVVVCDPDPQASRRIAAVIDRAARALPALSDVAMPRTGRLTIHADPDRAVRGADWIVDQTAGDLPTRQAMLARVQSLCRPAAIIACGVHGCTLAQLQTGAMRPGQIVVVRACDPVYLLAVVELSGSAANSSATLDRATNDLIALGMAPILTADGAVPIADHLRAALWDRAQALVRDGAATPDQIDAVVRDGLGLGWAQAGPFAAARTAENQDAALLRLRDDALVTMLRGLKACDHGAGVALNDRDRRVDVVPRSLDQVADLAQPVLTQSRAVPLDWTDYNGHMTEARYLHAFGDATDRMMHLVGCDADYVASGYSFFTAETHIRHLDEVVAGTAIHIDTQVLAGAGKKMHLFHRMWAGSRLLATGEHLLIHVSLTTRRACAPDARVAGPLDRIAVAHADLPLPEGAGRSVGRK